MFLRLILLTIIITPYTTFSQQKKLDSLLLVWKKDSVRIAQAPDSNDVKLLNSIGYEYMQRASANTIKLSNTAFILAEKIKYDKGQTTALANLARYYYVKCDYELSLRYLLKSSAISDYIQDLDGKAGMTNLLALIYHAQKKYIPAKKELYTAISLNKKLNNSQRLAANYFNLALASKELKQSDSTFYYIQLSKKLAVKNNDDHLIAMCNNRLGEFHCSKGRSEEAVFYYTSVIKNPKYQNDWENSFAYTGLAKCSYSKKKFNDAILYAHKGLELAQKTNTLWDIHMALKVLHEAYHAAGKDALAYKYQTLEKQYSDSLSNEKTEIELTSLSLKRKQAENDALMRRNQVVQQKAANSQMLMILIASVSASLFIILGLNIWNTRKKQRLYDDIQEKSEQILAQSHLIEKQNAELLESNRTKNKLFSIIGHDLRSPFATILGSFKMFKAGYLGEAEKEMILDKIYEQVSATSEMIDHLLTWANSQKEGLKTQKQEFCLSQKMEQIMEVFTNTAESKQISLTHEYAEPVYIFADPDQVHILFQNLIANAIKFTKPQGKVEISYQTSSTHLLVVVKDNGIGMSPEKLSQLFTMTGKGISTYGTNYEKGLGIGLSLVKQFADLNGASISVKSEENKGTEFIISFNIPISMEKTV
ncbi:tetratricopeptide repeat-containing sensor histidine kinase [Flectobacillus roseus]|uniref:tetratricopeptide repeat-containing sensor histidine kinase n=1 Tax=Flectobacillus roseus TaxID=502259 RepID=UPI0024B86AC3|nr:ATP-binding protein [Flectobacillus roseus]MDI9868658.1 ATP-binding protein [Flectobacillus roseus]